MTNKQAYRADGGDIGTGRLKEIASNVYSDEEKCWLAKRVLALLDDLEAAEKRIAELEANNDSATEALLKARRRAVTLPTGYSVRPGHPINETERGVMNPKDNGPWLSRHDIEHVLQVAGISIKEE